MFDKLTLTDLNALLESLWKKKAESDAIERPAHGQPYSDFARYNLYPQRLQALIDAAKAEVSERVDMAIQNELLDSIEVLTQRSLK